MLLAFELSGEHDTLPRAEVLACFEALGIDYEEKRFFNQLLIVETDGFEGEPFSKRLAMSRHIFEVLGICEAEKETILKMVDELKVGFGKGLSFGVRVKVKDSGLSSTDLERSIGEAIHRKGYQVNLKTPGKIFRGVINGDLCVFGLLLSSVDRGRFEARLPHLRPFFFPGVLLPRIARTLVNLSRVRSGDALFDPFCGTGGILIEGGYVGAELFGGDVQQKMVAGSRTNLMHYGLDARLIVGDAMRVPLKDDSMDAVVIDPPYGRSAIVKARSIEELYRQTLREVHRVLKEGRRLVIVSDFSFDEQIEEGFEIEERHSYRVHKSMTRHITVLVKSSMNAIPV
ncbi:MAG: methyltransferase domain-containing protein [Halobacteriota archaeon]|nr:methyltransferase domain-containing protein [Halobacteriota archaeon]